MASKQGNYFGPGSEGYILSKWREKDIIDKLETARQRCGMYEHWLAMSSDAAARRNQMAYKGSRTHSLKSSVKEYKPTLRQVLAIRPVGRIKWPCVGWPCSSRTEPV
jgi:hypothetical protein